MRHIIKYLSISLALFLVIACGNRTNDKKLVEADSLLSQFKNKEALRLLSTIDNSHYDDSDNAYYYLLQTQAKCRNNDVFHNDSLIDIAVDYYNSIDDLNLYTRALICKGEVNEALGNLDIAVDCYHAAEDIAAPDDYFHQGYAKLRLGMVYQNEYLGVKEIAMEKYKEALPLLRKIGDRRDEMLCLCHMGHLYRGISGMGDSAVVYLNQALEMAEQRAEDKIVFECLYSLAEYYRLFTDDYQKAKHYGMKAIAMEQSVVDHPRAHYCLAQIYALEGKADSAFHYLSTAPPVVESVDSMWHYKTLADIARCEGKVDQARRYLDESNKISASMLISSLNYRLLSVEKKYDTQKVELQNKSLHAELQNLLLIIAGCVIVLLTLIVFVIRYRSRYKLQKNEYESMTADFDASLRSSDEMKTALKRYEDSEKSQAASNASSVSGIKSVIDEQIKIMHQLILWSYEYDEKKFAQKFQSIMSLNDGENTESYWKNIQKIANDLHDNILVRAQEIAVEPLSESEVNFLALYSCGFSRTVIMICMKYKSLGTVYNKKTQTAKKLKVNNLDEFVNAHRNNSGNELQKRPK